VKENWTSGRFYQFCIWCSKIAYVNILWICFSLVGLGIFGILPSSVSLYTISRKWLTAETDLPIFKTFFETYKKEFFKANTIGLFMAIIGFVLYFNYIYVLTIQGTAQLFFGIPLFIFTVFYLVTLLYFLPVYVHYELGLFQYIKHSFYIGMANPIVTLLMVIAISFISLFLYFIPGLLPFFCPTLIALVIMFGGLRGFTKIEGKTKEYGITQEG
jgi:uncharacterized membrane protein YesL